MIPVFGSMYPRFFSAIRTLSLSGRGLSKKRRVTRKASSISAAISITGMDSTGMRLALANLMLEPEDRRPVPTDTRGVRQADPEVIQKKL
jgi:hypothetical protein